MARPTGACDIQRSGKLLTSRAGADRRVTACDILSRATRWRWALRWVRHRGPCRAALRRSCEYFTSAHPQLSQKRPFRSRVSEAADSTVHRRAISLFLPNRRQAPSDHHSRCLARRAASRAARPSRAIADELRGGQAPTRPKWPGGGVTSSARLGDGRACELP